MEGLIPAPESGTTDGLSPEGLSADDLSPDEPSSEEIRRALTELRADDANIAERAAIVLDRIATKSPKLLVPFVSELGEIALRAPERSRELSLRSIGIVTRTVPSVAAFLLPTLHRVLSKDSSEYIQEQSLEIIRNYARTGKQAAEKVVPLLNKVVRITGVKAGAASVVSVLKTVADVIQHLPVRSETATEETSELLSVTTELANTYKTSSSEKLRQASERVLGMFTAKPKSE